MTESYLRINYALRPAKHVERKLIAEALSRLDRLTDIAAVRYVGMGSVYFADFSLFHRRLGIQEMHSIEAAAHEEDKERFRFNVPYHTTLHFSCTSDVLPTLPWDRPAIVWLDYDGMLTDKVLTDLEIVVANCTPPTVLIVSVNVDPGKSDGRYARFVDNVSEELVPEGISSDVDLANWKTANASREVMGMLMNDVLGDRNGVLDDRLRAPQIFNFQYKDGARMLTVGWLLHATSSQAAVDACDLWQFPFVVSDAEAFEITVPLLTVRETLHLDAQLPSDSTISAPGVSATEVTAYQRLYRHLPSFVDADL